MEYKSYYQWVPFVLFLQVWFLIFCFTPLFAPHTLVILCFLYSYYCLHLIYLIFCGLYIHSFSSFHSHKITTSTLSVCNYSTSPLIISSNYLCIYFTSPLITSNSLCNYSTSPIIASNSLCNYSTSHLIISVITPPHL